VFILSAKYGLLEENDRISPYEFTLKQLPYNRRVDWAQYVLKQLRPKCDIDNDEFIILAGKDYYETILPELKYYSLPLEHLSMGQRISALERWLHSSSGQAASLQNQVHQSGTLDADCMELHRIFNASKRYNVFEIDSIPFENGIYVVFETGETYGTYDRIVRVGTHTSSNRLKRRLKDHFVKENKDGSIFIKNIGIAMLNKAKDPYLPIWKINTSRPENVRFVDHSKQCDIEKLVSTYLRQNTNFAVFRVDDSIQRLRLEEAIISTLNHTPGFKAHADWLGNSSTEAEIRDSGMWLKQGLDAPRITTDELRFVRDQVGNFSNAIPLNMQSKPDSVIYKKTSASDIRSYITNLLDQSRQRGEHTCILVSGDIHRTMGLANKMPSVCNAMYKLMRPGDTVLHTTPSGHSSTIKIEYQL
ncbi:MAG: hypothetical protein GXY86_17995, partial [Firmicutes bacterium]|nr:hypothetical protein [Bacillota bacterium]